MQHIFSIISTPIAMEYKNSADTGTLEYHHSFKNSVICNVIFLSPFFIYFLSFRVIFSAGPPLKLSLDCPPSKFAWAAPPPL